MIKVGLTQATSYLSPLYPDQASIARKWLKELIRKQEKVRKEEKGREKQRRRVSRTQRRFKQIKLGNLRNL